MWDKALSHEQSRVLLEALRAGDSEATNLLIKGHLRFAISRVNSFVIEYNCKHLMDDLVCEALCCLVEAVIAAKDLSHDNITGYINVHINGRLLDALSKSAIVRIPRSTMKEKGLRPMRSESLINTEVNDYRTYEIMECLNKSIITAFERKVMDLRLEEMSDRKIAEVLGVSTTQVFQTRKQVERRYHELSGEV
jgi:RNA polymerase sigma factor (sigma-70 family)